MSEGLRKFRIIGAKTEELNQLIETRGGENFRAQLNEAISTGERLTDIAQRLFPGEDPTKITGLLSNAGWTGDLAQHTPKHSSEIAARNLDEWRKRSPEQARESAIAASKMAAETAGPRITDEETTRGVVADLQAGQMTLQEIADKWGLTQNQIRRWSSKKQRPRFLRSFFEEDEE